MSDVLTPSSTDGQSQIKKRCFPWRSGQRKSLERNPSLFLLIKGITMVKHYKTSKCRNCPAIAQCTTNPKGRILERSEFAESANQNKKRVRAHPEIYAARQQIIEHIFGTIKRQWGFDHILLKGLRKNDGEFGLIYLVCNLRRIINILGVEGMKKWLRQLIFAIFCALHSIHANRRFEENKFWSVTA